MRRGQVVYYITSPYFTVVLRYQAFSPPSHDDFELSKNQHERLEMGMRRRRIRRS